MAGSHTAIASIADDTRNGLHQSRLPFTSRDIPVSISSWIMPENSFKSAIADIQMKQQR